jgi:hypothetical protein
MQNRAITGTTDWTKYSIVLHVPKDATGIAFGILLAGGPGEVWLSDANFEEVGTDAPVTGSGGSPSQNGPTNLDFEKQ